MINRWVSDNELRTNFQKYVQNAWDKVTALTFDEKNMNAYNELLARIVKTNGQYLDPDYKYDEHQENNDDDKVIPSAESLIEQLNALKNETPSLRNILKVFYSADYLSDITLYEISAIHNLLTVVRVAETLADTDRIENDSLTELFEIFEEKYNTDKEFLEVAEPVIDKITVGDTSLKSIFNAADIRDMLNHICSMFEEHDDILVKRMNVLLEDTHVKEGDYQEAYQKTEEMLRKLTAYIKQLENDVLYFNKALKESIHPNHMDFTVPECIAKW
jgi:hypothetical protein